MTKKLSSIGMNAIDSKKFLLSIIFILSQWAYSQTVEFNALLNQLEYESNAS
ncbi:MAG: hypothetical protein ACI9Z9_002453 [Litorivivens sp.]|jgi:hypothetical protein|tara:strand:+ start:4476 stop:4631 length:156 start_codon:yes stop_codon:yes gene_type:complete